MKLDSVTLVGFKSFAEPTVIKFPVGLTEIVGPNGSGKSNIVEAIRWALGEQSSKRLRSSQMTDVIFSGSATHQALDRARVTLQFDNRDHFIKGHSDVISVSRKLYRNGSSYYYLNGQECRLRDVQNLFVNSGIGHGSFAVISQGNVERIFKSKPTDRRFVVETAAGIYRYKFQKRSAQAKLEQTDDNLERIGDLTRELARQLTSLRHQKGVAQRFIQTQRTFHHLVALRNRFRLIALRQQLAQQRLRIVRRRAAIRQTHQKLVNLKMRNAGVNRHQHRIIKRDRALHQNLLDVARQIDQLSSRFKLTHQRIHFLRQRSAKVRAVRIRLRKRSRQIHLERQHLTTQFQTQGQVVARLAAGLKTVPAGWDQKQIKVTRVQLSKVRNHYVDLVRRLSQVDSQIDNYYHHRVHTKSRIKAVERRLKAGQSRVKSLQIKRRKTRVHVQALKDFLKKRPVVDDLASKISSEDRSLHQASERYHQVLRHFQLDRLHLKELRRLLASHANLYRGNRNLLNHAAKFPGILGPVVKFIQVPDRDVRAIEVALRSRLQQIIVTNSRVAESAIHYLTRYRLGRVTLLPIDAVRSGGVASAVVNRCQTVNGYIGIAADLVKMPVRLSQIKQHLLGRILVASDLHAAVLIGRIVHHRYRIVTLNGEIINAGGAISGGRGRYRRHGLLSQKYQLKHLKNGVEARRQRLAKFKSAVSRLQHSIKRLTGRLVHGRRLRNQKAQQLRLGQVVANDTRASLEREQRGVRDAWSALKTVRASASVSLSRLKPLSSQLKRRLAQNQSEVNALKSSVRTQQAQQATEQVRYQHSRERLIRARSKLSQLLRARKLASVQLTKVHQQLLQATKQIQTSHNRVLKLEQHNSRGQIPKRDRERVTKIKMSLKRDRLQRAELDQIQKRLNSRQDEAQQRLMLIQRRLGQDRFACRQTSSRIEQFRRLKTISDPKSFSKLHPSRLRLKTHLARLRRRLKSFKAVNLGSLQQFKAVNHRYQFLSRQLADLDRSKRQLLRTMNRVNFNLRHRFKVTFDRINHAFKQTFHQIFQGGQAKLALTDPDHLLTTGINIMAQPPGKRYRNMELLSGGERSLTAIALLFATLHVRPVPFCILDEAESALDAVNVSRFAQYMKRLDRQTQFIVITHRKTTMLYADHLYGVTMQNSGISKVISVNLKQIKEG